MDDGEHRLDVRVSDEGGRPLRARGLAAWLARVAPTRARGTVSIALVSDARVRALNRAYRRKDAATDVLSFPSGSSNLLARRGRFLGDIVIARGVARRQARVAGHAEATELRVLALHGLLHLLGYDHERDDGDMHRLEARLRRKGGLREGLIERSGLRRCSR
ncbi:MAG TPA: rRNA maturation RNase YbeY [Thermoanaerobaculia bacterium]|jgi:probable rRNA maturation factor